jgi:transcriptional regulator with XRE-family HTH domain
MSTPVVSFAVEHPLCERLSLASLRERQGMTLEEIARSTRIASHYLQAIEAEEFDKLPGGVYDTSYIRQYARAIGYNERALLDQYHARTEQAEQMKTPEIQVTRGIIRLGAAMELFRRHPAAKARHPA